MKAFNFIKRQVRDLIVEEDGQDGFEYLLVIGGVSVAVVIAAAALATETPGVVTAVCGAIDTIPAITLVC